METPLEKIRPSLRSGQWRQPPVCATSSKTRSAHTEPLCGAHLVKESTERLVISGEVCEHYRYERPYYYNWGPGKSSHADLEKLAPEKRTDHVLRTRRQIRRLVNANTATQIPKFITYTFAANIKTLEKANPLFTDFQKEFQRRYGRSRYLCVPEFQKRGAVHYHVIYFDLPYIKNIKEKIQKIWRHGFIKIIAVRNIKNVGAYVSKYLQAEIGDARSFGKKSYFCSRGMIQPEEIRDTEVVQYALDFYRERYTFKEEAIEQFDSRFGKVTYTRFTLAT